MMSNLRYIAIAVVVTVVASACGKSTEPESALNGPWTTGHRTDGLEGGLDLTWTPGSVRGTGSYHHFSFPGAIPVGCGATLKDSGSMTLSATRTSVTEIAGTMRFDGGWSPAYSGILTDGSSIRGKFFGFDGSTCSFELSRGEIP
jgi:hypothetical protein